MTGEERDDGRQGRGAYLRRNKRVRVRFPVRVELPLEDGRSRILRANTVVVSHAGATLDVDEPIALGMGLQVSPPFGGTLLAEVNGVWLDEETGRHRVSIRLIDPASWTSPERFVAPAPGAGPERVNVGLHPWVWQLLAEYTAYLKETAEEPAQPGPVADGILERALLADEQFQRWFTGKINEDIEAWEKQYVQES
ncbi:MAG TPA: hypothetical protein VF659_10810 [Pyrinomonadaceae bacterium]|jgi:hypothetical protein